MSPNADPKMVSIFKISHPTEGRINRLVEGEEALKRALRGFQGYYRDSVVGQMTVILVAGFPIDVTNHYILSEVTP